MTPAGARELVQRGHEVLVERGAGDGSSFPDDVYEAVGAKLMAAEDVWAEAELLLEAEADGGRAVGDAAGDELPAPARRLVVEQDS